MGDERIALLPLTVDANLAGMQVTLPEVRRYLLDANITIKVEQVILYASPD